jgi:hypothetical protein
MPAANPGLPGVPGFRDLSPVPDLVGMPSDGVPEILATGRSGISTIFISMSARHPEGRDADYIEWHSLDHRPEQYRLADLRGSLRLVSTPSCRSVRAVSSPRFDAVDHVMTYLFAERRALDGFLELSDALRAAGRIPELLPMVERAVYEPAGMVAASRLKIGADVLPWWPATGVYLVIEEGREDPSAIADVPGVGGVWWMTGVPADPPHSTADNSGLQITYCYLDEDPVQTGAQLRGYLEKRWANSETVPLLAAPFHLISTYEWGRYLP